MARLADTMVDGAGLEPAHRRAGLGAVREFLQSGDQGQLERICRALPPAGLSPAEGRLLSSAGEIARAHLELEPEPRERNRRVLLSVLNGLQMDLDHFGGSCAARPAALPNREVLDRYCFCVAGSVGRYWTEMHLAGGNREIFFLGERYGKGLQLVNILRDLAADLGRGRCYLPLDDLRRADLEPSALASPGGAARLRRVFDHWWEVARGHLGAGLRYLELLPKGAPRLLACTSWPLLIGLRTLDLLASRPLSLADRRPVKITRRQVYWLLALGAMFAPLPGGPRLLPKIIGRGRQLRP